MSYLFTILSLTALGCSYFYYNKKLDLLKKQLMLTRIKSSTPPKIYTNNLDNLTIKFIIPSYTGGTLKSNSKLYLSPLLNSHILKEINSNIEITILDCAEINNETWFYVNIPSMNNINSKGWVKYSDISIFYSNTSSVNKI